MMANNYFVTKIQIKKNTDKVRCYVILFSNLERFLANPNKQFLLYNAKMSCKIKQNFGINKHFSIYFPRKTVDQNYIKIPLLFSNSVITYFKITMHLLEEDLLGQITFGNKILPHQTIPKLLSVMKSFDQVFRLRFAVLKPLSKDNQGNINYDLRHIHNFFIKYFSHQ